MVNRKSRKREARILTSVPDPGTSVTAVSEPIGDYRGHLAITLAAAVVAIVGVIVLMIVLAAT